MSKLENIGIRHTAIGGRVVLARFGRDKSLALEQRDAHSEFFQTIVSYAFDGRMPAEGESAAFQFGGGDEQFVITVERLANPTVGEPRQ